MRKMKPIDERTREDWLDHLNTIMDISNWCRDSHISCYDCCQYYDGFCRRNDAILELRYVINGYFNLEGERK